MQEFTIHPIAKIFPEMDEAAFENFQRDVQTNGLREPQLWLYEGQILDGRHRYRVCQKLELPYHTRDYTGGDPIGFVISLNLHRRHLDESQRAMVAGRIANMKQGERTDLEPCLNSSKVQPISQLQAAEMLNVSRFSTQQAVHVQAVADPDIVTAVDRGLIAVSQAAKLAREPVPFQRRVAEKALTGHFKTASAAIQEVRREDQKVQLEQTVTREIEAPTGCYDVLIIDPPWPVTFNAREVRPNQVTLPYPRMTIEEIQALSLPMAEDCHVWLWTTQRFLPQAFRCVETWGLTYVCCFVWHKPGGMQPIGLPQFNAEFCVYARKGTPIFLDTTQFFTCFDAPRSEHSAKPSEFYEMVRRVTGGRRIDMFARTTHEGFDTWGNEAP